jgi:DNA-binding beta-propeller fold protein YncE
MCRLKGPTGIAVDRQGTVYVADSGNHRVVELAALDLWGTSLPEGHATASPGRATGPIRMSQPVGVAIDARSNIYVTDASTPHVTVLQPDGKVLAAWGRRGSDPGQFQSPTGIHSTWPAISTSLTEATPESRSSRPYANLPVYGRCPTGTASFWRR